MVEVPFKNKSKGTASLALSKGNKIYLSTALKLSYSHILSKLTKYKESKYKLWYYDGLWDYFLAGRSESFPRMVIESHMCSSNHIKQM